MTRVTLTQTWLCLLTLTFLIGVFSSLANCQNANPAGKQMNFPIEDSFNTFMGHGFMDQPKTLKQLYSHQNGGGGSSTASVSMNVGGAGMRGTGEGAGAGDDVMQPTVTGVGMQDIGMAGSSMSQTAAMNYGMVPKPKGPMRFNLTMGGRKITYKFHVGYIEGVTPDGVRGAPALGINGMFPCPTIEAMEGDYVVIEVINNIIPRGGQGEATNTSLHWHGLLQRGSPLHDGVNHITQCPIKTGSRRRYHFHIQQSGTYWYHSHLRSQYTEGLWGSFLVHPRQPKTYAYDRRRIIKLSDWYQTSAEENERFYLSQTSRGGPPYPFSMLMNGMGRYNCSIAALQRRQCDPNAQYRPVFRIQPDKVNAFHLINSAAWSSFNFTIDGHELEVMEVEGTYLTPPVRCQAIHISPGQRYTFIIHPRKTVVPKMDFLIRAYLRRDFLFQAPGVTNINPFPDAVYDEVTGVIRYVMNDAYGNTKQRFSWIQPIPPPMVNVADMIFFDDLNAPSGIPPPQRVDVEFPITLDFHNGPDGIRRGSFDMRPFVQPSFAPLIHFMLNGGSYPQGVQNHFINLYQVVQIIINNPGAGSHPIHLHGHNFHVMADGQVGAGNFDATIHPLTQVGAIRDTIIVKERSHLVFRFVADNPGIWVMHCHIDWHLLSGMMVVFTEGAHEARKEFEFMEEDKRICRDHGIIIP